MDRATATVEISLFPLKYSFELPIEPLLNMIDEVINSVKYRIVRVQSSVENVVFIIKPLVETTYKQIIIKIFQIDKINIFNDG